MKITNRLSHKRIIWTRFITVCLNKKRGNPIMGTNQHVTPSGDKWQGSGKL